VSGRKRAEKDVVVGAEKGKETFERREKEKRNDRSTGFGPCANETSQGRTRSNIATIDKGRREVKKRDYSIKNIRQRKGRKGQPVYSRRGDLKCHHEEGVLRGGGGITMEKKSTAQIGRQKPPIDEASSKMAPLQKVTSRGKQPHPTYKGKKRKSPSRSDDDIDAATRTGVRVRKYCRNWLQKDKTTGRSRLPRKRRGRETTEKGEKAKGSWGMN